MPGNRRTALMTLSAEERSFLKQEPAHEPELTVHETDRKDVRGVEKSFVPRANGANGSSGRAASLRSVTLRLHPDVAALLRRAAIERSLEYDEPYTQQGIAEQALRDWLTGKGYVAAMRIANRGS